MRKRKLLSWLLLPFTALFFAACEEDSGPTEMTLDELCPETIDEKNIDFLKEYGEYDKTPITNHVDYSQRSSASASDLIAINAFASTIKKNGVLTAYGDSFRITDYQNINGYANSGAFAGFMYLQNVEKSYFVNETEFNICDSAATKVEDFDVGDKVHSGAIVILKSFDSNTWNVETYVTNINKKYINYMPSADDVFQGVYLRFINTVKFKFIARYEEQWTGALWWAELVKVPVYETFNMVQDTTIYVANDSFDIKFTCQSVEDYQIDSEEYSEEQISMLHKAVNLTDNSVSISYINATYGNVKSNEYSYTYVGKDKTNSGVITENTKFTEPGKYVFNLKNSFGDEKNITLYLIDPGTDLALSTLFGSGIVDNTKRMFDSNQKFQTYMVGKTYDLIELPDYLPARYGGIYYFENENNIKNNIGTVLKTIDGSREAIHGVFDLEGYYVFDFYASNESSSGDILHYTFTYYISSDSSYAPSVNYSLITSPMRANLLATKVYGVMLPTTGGGSYQFIFPYSEKYISDAYELAVEIEELSVEIVDYNGGKCYYYKSVDNPLVKVNYLSKIELYDAINYYADKNLSVIYLENDIPFATQVVNDEDLKDIVNTSIRTSVRVVSNDKVLEDLRTGDIYLNDFKFAQVADFEVDSVSYIDESSNSHSIAFDTDLDSLFSGNQRVTIKETNWNGETKYNAIYQKNNTCSILVKVNGENRTITNGNDGENINANGFEFISASDEFDSQTLIAISNGSRRDVFTMSEIVNLALPKGNYTITAINRNKQTFSVNVTSNGEMISTAQSVYNYNHDIFRSNVEKVTEGTIDDIVIIVPPATSNGNNMIYVYIFVPIGAALLIAAVIIIIIILRKRSPASFAKTIGKHQKGNKNNKQVIQNFTKKTNTKNTTTKKKTTKKSTKKK